MDNLIYVLFILMSYAAYKPEPNIIHKIISTNLDSVVVKYEGETQLDQKLFIGFTDSIGTHYEYGIKSGSKLKIYLPGKAVLSFQKSAAMPEFALVASGDTLAIKDEEGKVHVRKPNVSQWYLSSSFDQFYNTRYRIINLHLDSIFNALYTRNFSPDRSTFTLAVKKDLSPTKRLNLFNQFLEAQWMKYSTQLAALDSLRRIGTIDDFYKDWITVRNKVNALSFSIGVLRQSGREDKVPALFEKYEFINDRYVFACFPEYRAFIEQRFVPSVISREAGYSKQDVFGDAKYVYDSSIRYVNGRTLDLVRFLSVKHIKQYEPVHVQKQYFEKFYEDVSDVAFINYVKNNLNFSEVKGAKNSVITADTKETLSWEHLLEQHKGRLVYIDFWASWCAPCRKAMPASEKLRTDYQSKPVSFVYLSIDSDFANWKKANGSEHLDNQFSYLLVNGSRSQLGQVLKMDAIPRYLLIGKDGQIVHYNAPPPDSKEVRKLIDQVLAN